METAVRSSQDCHVEPTPSNVDALTLTLNHGTTFGIFDPYGDVLEDSKHLYGIFHAGTRYISLSKLAIFGETPMLLSATILEDNEVSHVDLANPKICIANELISEGRIYLRRSKLIRDAACYEKLTFRNYHVAPMTIPVTLRLAGDFKDMFEVRGVKRRSPRPTVERSRPGEREWQLAYRGLDQVCRTALCHFFFDCHIDENGIISFAVELPPHGEKVMEYRIVFHAETGAGGHEDTAASTGAAGSEPRAGISASTYDQKLHESEQEIRGLKGEFADIYTSNEQFNQWVNRSRADLIALISEVNGLSYPFAGVPWFNTVFGRDGLLTAFQTLLYAPFLAREVLLFLAACQARDIDRSNEAEPGKILHELRQGELANIGEVPFKRYYGTADATPLFVWLAGLYFARTNDIETIRAIWPNIKLAMEWIERFGDQDGDLLVEYMKQLDHGLTNEAWKDSEDAISHRDGSLAQGPIAVCEVQGYVYAAKLHAAKLARIMGEDSLAHGWSNQAERLRARFHEQFWMEDAGYIALALDGAKQRCEVLSSNPGHCLATEILDPPHAAAVAGKLLGNELFSGWGVRTLGKREERYNPMSYHNGSVWPHDNAIIAYGLARYGWKGGVVQICQGLFEASLFLPLQRMPELFCGFERLRGEGPTLYPVACSPQAWSVATVFLLLQSLLGLVIDAPARSIVLDNPVLPDFLDDVRLRRVPLPGDRSDGQPTGWLDLRFLRHGNDVGVEIIHKPPNWTLQIMKS